MQAKTACPTWPHLRACPCPRKKRTHNNAILARTSIEETSNQTATFPCFFFTFPEPSTAPQPVHNMYLKRAASGHSNANDENVENGSSTGASDDPRQQGLPPTSLSQLKQLTSPHPCLILVVVVVAQGSSLPCLKARGDP